MQVRYIRDFTAGPNGNHWVEIEAYSNGVNVALGKTVTVFSGGIAGGTGPEVVTDGTLGSFLELVPTGGNPGVEVDLGEVIDIQEITIWHYYQDGRLYYGTKTEVSTDGAAWEPVFDSAIEGTYSETAGGHTITLAAAEPPTWGSTVDWIEPQGVAIEGGTLRKTGTTAGWNAGAQSSQQTNGDPFTIEFTARTTNERIAFGLDEGRDTISYGNKDIDLCWEINPDGLTEINVRETNEFRGTYVAGDVFQVRLRDQDITFLQNGVEIHVFTGANDFPYFADCSIYNEGDTFTPTLYMGDEPTATNFESTASLNINFDMTAEQIYTEPTATNFESTGDLTFNLDITASQNYTGEAATNFESTAGLTINNFNITTKQVYKEVIPTPEPAGPYVYEKGGAAIYIFDRDEVLQIILSNDKQGSCPLIEAKMSEELNGPFTLEFEIPADHEQAELVQEDYLAAAKDKEGNWQLFFIRELEDIHSTQWIKRAFCQHSIVELEDTIIEDFFVDRKDAPTTLGEILFGTRWELGISQTHSEVHDLTVKYKTALEAYTKFLQRWGVEARYRIQIAGQTITKRYIDIYSQRGTDTGKRFEYNKDMNEIIRTIDTSTIKTALYGLGKENELGNPLTFTDINGGYPYVVDEAAKTKWGLQLAGGTKRHRWGIFSDSNIETPQELRAATVAALDVVKNPLLTYQMKVIDITEIAGVPHEAVSLGLTITAIDRDLKIQEKARCIKQVTDLLNENFSEITLGNFLPSQTKSTQSQLQEIADIAAAAAAAQAGALTAGSPISTAWLEGEINALNNAITAGSGTVTVTEDQGILVENIEKTKALRLLGGILAIANSKDPGTGLYDWRTFGTGDGFVADQITSGSMLFDRARGGTLLLGGTNNANGRLLVYDKDGNVVGDLDAAAGGFHELYVGEFRADNVLNSNDKTIVFSVHPDVGDDNRDGLTADTALRRVQEAISRIPKHNNGRVEIYVKNVVFNEYEIKIEGFYGNGTIAVFFNGAQHNGMIYVRNNSQTVELYNGKVNQIYGTQYFRDGTITIQRTHSVYMKDMQVYSRRNVDFGVKVQAAYCNIDSCNFYDATTAGVNADFGGVVDMISDSYGSGAWAGIRAIGTGRIACHNGSVPKGTIDKEVAWGGEIIGTTSHAVGTPAVLSAPPITTLFTATNILSWNTKNGWQSQNNYIYQGEWSDKNSWGFTTYYGNYKGCFWFNNSAIATAISGRTVLSARIRLKRLTIGGLSLPFPANLWTITTPISGIGAGEPAVDFNIGGGTTYRWGEEDAIGIPAWIITGLANNSYGGFALYNANGFNYMIFASEATLEITYQ